MCVVFLTRSPTERKPGPCVGELKAQSSSSSLLPYHYRAVIDFRGGLLLYS